MSSSPGPPNARPWWRRWWPRRRGAAPPAPGTGRRAAPLLSRLTADWWVAPASPAAELRASLATIRHRARDLERTHPIARRYLSLVADQVVGTGIRLQVRNTLPDGRPNVRANDAIEGAWALWGERATCTIDEQWNWTEVLRAAIRMCARDGEVFLRLIEGATPYGLAVQFIDPDLIDEQMFRPATPGAPAIRMGVEVDAWGRPLAYYVRQGYPYDVFGGGGAAEVVRIPANEILHLMLPRRPGQVRGESWLEPVMPLLRHLDGYTEAEIVAARTAAAKMGFILPSADAAVPDPASDQPTEIPLAVEPGSIDRLAPGETFAPWDPTHPSQNYERFVVQVTKLIAAGLNVSYASLTGDLRETNYSSARLGVMQERDTWRSLQRWLITSCCEPVFRRWRDVAWLRGHLALRMPPTEYDAVDWQPRGWSWVDPGRDIHAAALAVAYGFGSPQQIVGEDGRDHEEVLRQIAAARRLAADLGVPIAWPQGVIPPPPDAGDDPVSANAATTATSEDRESAYVAPLRRVG